MRLPLAAALLSAFAPAATAQRPLAKPVIDKVGTATRVMNPGPTAWADTNGWKLVLERTIQPAAGQPGELEDPTEVVLLRDGRVVTAQRDPAMIRLYDAQGKFVRDIGRNGDGPAEYQRPVIAIVGDTVVAYNGASGRATLLTLDGKRVREFLTNAHHDGPPITIDNRGRIRLTGSRVTANQSLAQWIYFDLKGKRIDSMVPPRAVEPKVWTVKSGGGIASYYPPLTTRSVNAFRSDGAVLYGVDNKYELLLTRTGRDTLLIFGRTGVAAADVPASIRDSLFNLYARRPELAGVASKSDLSTHYPLWNEATFDGNGNIWISTGLTNAGTRHFEVFNPAGHYLGAVAAPFGNFRRTSWTGDRVAVVGTDKDDLPIIRVYRIDRRGK
ncbi:MAG: hypothetical protein ABIZ70_01540 [Gemmatimonadales bacterium]